MDCSVLIAENIMMYGTGTAAAFSALQLHAAAIAELEEGASPNEAGHAFWVAAWHFMPNLKVIDWMISVPDMMDHFGSDSTGTSLPHRAFNLELTLFSEAGERSNSLQLRRFTQNCYAAHISTLRVMKGEHRLAFSAALPMQQLRSLLVTS